MLLTGVPPREYPAHAWGFGAGDGVRRSDPGQSHRRLHPARRCPERPCPGYSGRVAKSVISTCPSLACTSAEETAAIVTPRRTQELRALCSIVSRVQAPHRMRKKHVAMTATRYRVASAGASSGNAGE